MATISGSFIINILEDGVTYFLETSNASATIPADQSSVAYNGTVRAYKRDGDGDKAEYACYITVWKKKGTTYTRWLYTTDKQTSYTISGTASQSDCDTIVVTMSDIAITSHSAYLAEIEIPVYKAGDNAVVYSIKASVGSVTIATGNSGEYYTGRITPYRRIGSNAQEAYTCYIQVWRKKGSGYYLVTQSTSKETWKDITSLRVTQATYDSIVVTMSDTILSSHAGYLAEVEVPVYKAGDTGAKGDDGVVYSITASVSSITIAAGATAAYYTGRISSYRRIGNNAQEAYTCYIQVWRKKDNDYYRLDTSNAAWKDITSQRVTTASCDAIVATMSDTVLTAHAGYLAEVEIPVYKIGDNGTRGKTGRFYYYAGDWAQPDQQIHWVQTAKELGVLAYSNRPNTTSVRDTTNNTITVNCTGTSQPGIYVSRANLELDTEHTYMVAVGVANDKRIGIYFGSWKDFDATSGGAMQVCKGICGGAAVDLLRFYYTETGTFTLYYIRCIDLTAIYGAGSEPATVEDFEADYRVWKGMASTDTIDYSAMLKTDEMLDVFGNSYLVSDQGAPWFQYGHQNYVFVPEENGTYTRAQMGTPEEAAGKSWTLMWNDMDFLISTAVFAEFAKFGSAIISGDWMISTNGTIGGVDYADGAMATVDGVTQPAYMFFDSEYPDTDNGGLNFIPYRSEDLRTGSSYLMNAHVRGTVDAQILKTTVMLCRHYSGNPNAGQAAPIMPFKDAQGVRITDWYPEDQVWLWNYEDVWFGLSDIDTTSDLWLPSVLILVSDPRSSSTSSKREGNYTSDYAYLPHPQRFIGHELEVIVPHSYYANQVTLMGAYYVAGQSAMDVCMIDTYGDPVAGIVLNKRPSGDDDRPQNESSPCRVRLVGVNMSVYGNPSKAFWMIVETENVTFE